MTTHAIDYLAEWIHLALDMDDGFEEWEDAFDEARVAWQLEQAQRLLRESKQAALAQRERALVYHGEGMLHAQLGDWSRAVDQLMQAVDLLEDSPHVEEGIMILSDLGMVLRLQANHEGAQAAHEQALSLAQAIEHPRLIAEGWSQLGLDLEHRGEAEQAIGHFQQALAQYEALDDQEEVARTLNHLGEAYWRTDDLAAAYKTLERALAQARAGDAYLAAQIEGNLGNVYYEQGHLAEAEACWRSALAAFDALNVVFDKVGLLNNLGGLAFSRQDYTTAQSYFQESLALARDLGDERGINEALHNVAVVYGCLNETEDVRNVNYG